MSQKESTPFHPRSPYGVVKLYAYWITVNYRESYEMYACNGVLFNHDNAHREETFVMRKISCGLARVDAGLDDYLFMGNLDSLRDLGPAEWSEAFEGRRLLPELAVHAVCLLASRPWRMHLWKQLLRWWGRWRHLQAPLTAQELIAKGWNPGPEIGQELQRLRRERLMIAR